MACCEKLKTFYNRGIRETLVPLLIMTITPILVVLLPYIIIHYKADLLRILTEESIFEFISYVWYSVELFDAECWFIILGTMIWAIITLVSLPGKKYYGPPTPNNYRAQYWSNGFKYYLISMVITISLIWHFSVLHLYYKIPDLISALCVFGFIISFLIYLKGLLIPDPGIYNMTKNPIFDFYWGIELYPQLGKYISLKLLINSRFGLWLWQVLILICWKSHYELYSSYYNRGNIVYPIAVTSILQTVYITKFYYCEDGYMTGSIDVILDRFGYMEAWGCIAWIPGFFSLSSLYLVKNSPMTSFSGLVNFLILLFGLLAISGNYWVDRQKQQVRETDGQCTIWSKKPVIIRAKYKDDNGTEHSSILLASGFWGIARHLNYLFELMIGLAFGLPALTTSSIPYFYFFIILILIIHRTFREDAKNSAKYGRYWEEYCKLVPYKMIPYIY